MKLRNNFKQKLHDYYQNQKIWPRYLVLFFIIFVIIIFSFGNNRVENGKKMDYSKFNFVGSYIPLDGKYFYNREKIDREIALTKLNTAQFMMIYKREKQYLDYIAKELVKNGIPSDLKYLAVAESALRVNAYSKAGAVGLRQFMPGTAQKYGLIVNKQIDQRYDFKRSTQAAIDYFIDLYRKFKDWDLVVAAYNRGENGLLRDIQAQHQSGYYDLRLNNETSRYVFRIIAIKYLMENINDNFDINIFGEQYQNPKIKTIKVGKIDNLIERSISNGYTYAEIRQFNPWIRGNSLPKGKREIKIAR